MRLAERTSRVLLLYWPRNSSLNCAFSDLFENEISEIEKKEVEALRKKKNIYEQYRIVHTWRLKVLPEDPLPNNFSRTFPSRTGKNIDLEYDRIPLAVRNSFLIYVNKLIPKQYITKKVDNFSKHFDENTVSVSIRTWEDGESAQRPALFDIENVYVVLDKMKGSKFFVSSDSKEVLEKLIKRYKNRVLHYPLRTFPGDRNSRMGIEDAMVKLLLLSKNKELKASYYSTFPEMAWWLGGCKARVEIIPPKTYFFKKIHLGPELSAYCMLWKWFTKFTLCTKGN